MGLTDLPPSIGDLTALRRLDLSNNRFSSIPSVLQRLRNLEVLDLSGNPLASLPNWLFELTSLQSLELTNCQVRELPSALAKLTRIRKLHIGANSLTALPDEIGALSELQELIASHNALVSLPTSIGRLSKLQLLYAYSNKLSSLPDSVGKLSSLRELHVSQNMLEGVPATLTNLSRLELLGLAGNTLKVLPDSLAPPNLEKLFLSDNHLTDLPSALGAISALREVDVRGNPLALEISEARGQGLDALKRYLRAKNAARVVLNEAKLILVGEGEVGKTSLLAALRDEGWQEGRPTTHGIEIKRIELHRPGLGTILLNAWDFGGQRVYRPTHQLFFSAPAIYLVVWKPREGAQQGLVKEWISLIKNRAAGARVIVVATHGGPQGRKPDIDRQELWDQFGKDTILDFVTVDSKPDERGERPGLLELKRAIAEAAFQLPEVGRAIPKRWADVRDHLKRVTEPYLSTHDLVGLCCAQGMSPEDARDFIRVSHSLGDIIHYEHDPVLRDIVVLKPDWLATAISFVLDDGVTRDNHGLVSAQRLSEVWDDPNRKMARYAPRLHAVFRRLMERFDLCYRIADTEASPGGEVYLVAQLVPDIRPTLMTCWPLEREPGDDEQVQLCKVVHGPSGRPESAEGIFFQLVVRLHKYSLGRSDHAKSVHWQRGLVLRDDFGASALLEHVGGDIRVTVRSPYPERFLSILAHEVKWLVENFWSGLKCNVMVPCADLCSKSKSGLFEVEKLIDSKRRGKHEYPCSVCGDWPEIDGLLRHAPAARPNPLGGLVLNSSMALKELTEIRNVVSSQVERRLDGLETGQRELVSRVEDAFLGLMRALDDEARDGPRLFSLEPVDRKLFRSPKWAGGEFRVTLWCEHSRLPLTALNSAGDTRGVYTIFIPREWLASAAGYVGALTYALSFVLPVQTISSPKLDNVSFRRIADQLGSTQDDLKAFMGDKSSQIMTWLEQDKHVALMRARGGPLRQLHAWLKQKDPSFGDLVRVQNRRHEFLWVHKNFEAEY